MRRLIDLIWCFLNGVCSKHGTKKQLYGWGECCYYDCSECVHERDKKFEARRENYCATYVRENGGWPPPPDVSKEL